MLLAHLSLVFLYRSGSMLIKLNLKSSLVFCDFKTTQSSNSFRECQVCKVHLNFKTKTFQINQWPPLLELALFRITEQTCHAKL